MLGNGISESTGTYRYIRIYGELRGRTRRRIILKVNKHCKRVKNKTNRQVAMIGNQKHVSLLILGYIKLEPA